MADCLVIGAGLIGMLTARELARAGRRVQLIERGSPGCEASWAGGGILSPLYPWRYPEAVTRLATWGQRCYPELAQALRSESGIDPEWTRSGLLILDTDEAETALRWARAHAVTVEYLEGAAAVAAVEPHCRRTDAALWLPAVAQIRNPRLIRALRIALERDGVVIHEGTEVGHILHTNGVVRGVRAGNETFAARNVVLAAGAWSARLLEDIGLHLPLTAVRGQMLLYRVEPDLLRRIVLDRGRYAIPRRDGHVLVGSTVEHAGFDKSTTAEARRELEEAAAALVPGLARHTIVRHWSGLRPGSPDGIPWIGPVPGIAGLYLNAGHYRNGVVLGPASARLLADMMLDRPPIVDVTPYAPGERGQGA